MQEGGKRAGSLLPHNPVVRLHSPQRRHPDFGGDGPGLRGQHRRHTPSSEPVGQTPFPPNTGVPPTLPVQDRRRICGLESLAKPVAHFVNKPLTRNPKSGPKPCRCIARLSTAKRATSANPPRRLGSDPPKGGLQLRRVVCFATLPPAKQVLEGESGSQARRGCCRCFIGGQEGEQVRVEQPSPWLRLRSRGNSTGPMQIPGTIC